MLGSCVLRPNMPEVRLGDVVVVWCVLDVWRWSRRPKRGMVVVVVVVWVWFGLGWEG
jgi:hypothetical protein